MSGLSGFGGQQERARRAGGISAFLLASPGALWRVLTLAALLLLAVLVPVTVVTSHSDDELRAHGQRVTGIVTHVQQLSSHQRLHAVWGAVHQVSVDTADRADANHRVGDVVDLLVEPNHPGRVALVRGGSSGGQFGRRMVALVAAALVLFLLLAWRAQRRARVRS